MQKIFKLIGILSEVGEPVFVENPGNTDNHWATNVVIKIETASIPTETVSMPVTILNFVGQCYKGKIVTLREFYDHDDDTGVRIFRQELQHGPHYIKRRKIYF